MIASVATTAGALAIVLHARVTSGLSALTPSTPGATPSPSASTSVNPNLVTPGAIGFGITFLIAVAVVFLIIDMVRRIRRVRYRAEIDAKLDAEQRADGSVNSADRSRTPRRS